MIRQSRRRVPDRQGTSPADLPVCGDWSPVENRRQNGRFDGVQQAAAT